MTKQRKSVIILLGFLVIIFLFFLVFGEGDLPSRSSVPVAQQQQNTKLPSPYTTNLATLESSIIDQENNVAMVDVQYALARLIDDDPNIFEYPFYAMQNQKGTGYVGIMKTEKGDAIFLIPSYATLNQSNKFDLEASIKAVNGTAKGLNANLDFATGYDALEVLGWVK